MSAWDWLQAIFFWLSIGSLILTVTCAVLLQWAGWITARLADWPLPTLDAWPAVSLIAPARNEERNL